MHGALVSHIVVPLLANEVKIECQLNLLIYQKVYQILSWNFVLTKFSAFVDSEIIFH